MQHFVNLNLSGVDMTQGQAATGRCSGGSLDVPETCRPGPTTDPVQQPSPLLGGASR